MLVVDAGEPRNAPAAHMHGYLSRDGMSPGELLAAGRAEVAGYGVELVEDRVVGVDDRLHGDGSRAAGRARPAAPGVATGLSDELPDIPGVAERWGRDVLHCPYCHGCEVRDQPLGVFGDARGAQALLVRQWSADVTLFLHTASRPPTSRPGSTRGASWWRPPR